MANNDAIELRVHYGFTSPTTIDLVGINCEWLADDTTSFSPPTTLFSHGAGHSSYVGTNVRHSE